MLRVHFSLGVLVLIVLSGCDKLQQMTDKTAEDAPATATTETPAATTPAATEPPVPVPQKTPQEIIDAFMALPNHERTDARFQELTALPEGLEQIDELDLSTSPITDAGISGIAKLTELKVVNLSRTGLSNSAITHLAGLIHLESLTLEDMSRIDGEALNTIKEIKTVRELRMSNTVIGDEAITMTAELPLLEVLHVNGVRNMTGKQFANMAKQGHYKGLRELAFNNTQFGTYALENPGAFDSLEVIQAQHSDINDGSLVGLGSCPNLREAYLQNNSFSPGGLKPLQRLKKLEVLRLDNCAGVVDTAFDILKTMKQLKVLGLEGCPCSPAAVKQLKEKFLKETTIHHDGKVLAFATPMTPALPGGGVYAVPGPAAATGEFPDIPF